VFSVLRCQHGQQLHELTQNAPHGPPTRPTLLLHLLLRPSHPATPLHHIIVLTGSLWVMAQQRGPPRLAYRCLPYLPPGGVRSTFHTSCSVQW
jgi:hypothetical protein